MDANTLKYYKTIGQLQMSISKSQSLDEALRNGLKIILDNSKADYAIIWYLNNKDNRLHPYFWYCPTDITSISYDLNESLVGKTYKTKKAIKINEEVNKIKEATGLHVSSAVCIPFSDSSFNLGCVEFFKKGLPFTEEEIDLCQILCLMIELSLEENADNFVEWQEKETILKVNGLEKTYVNGEIATKVLKGVNFDVFKGELLCFLGESGCGKSTVLNIIGGLDKADKGSFIFEGKDYAKASTKELTEYRRENIGFIFQSYNLMPNLTAKQNLDLIGELVDDPLDSLKCLDIVGMKDKTDNYPSQLSGGQQQRISIARALVKKPKLIFADEPTAALDYQTSIEVLTALENVIKSGTTLIMVTHNEEITRMADRVIRFRNGQTYEISVNHHPVKAKDLVW